MSRPEPCGIFANRSSAASLARASARHARGGTRRRSSQAAGEGGASVGGQ
jgi:hypothetical protein